MDIQVSSRRTTSSVQKRVSIGKTTENRETESSLKKYIEGSKPIQKIYNSHFSSRATTTALADEYSLQRRKELLNKTSFETDQSQSPKKSEETSQLNCSGELNFMSGVESINKKIPSPKYDIRNSKLFLQKQGLGNLSIWNHLTCVLNKIIAEQPENVIDYFEEYSRKVKAEQVTELDLLRDVYIPSPQLESAKNQLSLIKSYKIKDEDEPTTGEDDEETKEPPMKMDLEEVMFHFRQAGITIPSEQLVPLNIAIKKLTSEKSLLKQRFWGKILGTKQDYFIMECEFSEEEYEKRVQEDEQAEEEKAIKLVKEKEEAEIRAKEMAEKYADAEYEEEKEALTSEEIHLERGIQDDGQMKDDSDTSDTNQDKAPSSDKGNKFEDKESIEKMNGGSEEDGDYDEGNNDTENYKDEEYKDEIENDKVRNESEEKSDEEEKEDPLLPSLPPPKKLLKYKIPPTLLPVRRETEKIPAEKVGSGLNRKIYYVCNIPELEWTELPKVTPEEIEVARQIQVCFTGDLESKIVTYPAFPGTEKNYLRTQVARISASTLISPLGFYKFKGAGGEEEEEEEVEEEEEEGEAGEKKDIVENSKYKPVPMKDLLDPSFASWVHHSPYILQQGRAEWWNSKRKKEAEEEEEEEEAEEEEDEVGEEDEKEKGPAMLSTLTDDQTIENSLAWCAYSTHKYNTHLAAAVMRSNLWPGASTFAAGRTYENIYVGWGQKHLPNGFSPAALPHPEYEYELGPEIMEIQDPTVQVEQEWREAHKKKPSPNEEGEEAEEEEEEEGDEDEEEEDD